MESETVYRCSQDAVTSRVFVIVPPNLAEPDSDKVLGVRSSDRELSRNNGCSETF
jgi:hypothetical protein